MYENKENLPAVQKMNNMLSSDSVRERFSATLKDHSDLFVSSILAVYSADSVLQKCDPALVIKECLTAATLNLPINKSLGFAYIIPYNKKKKVGNNWTDNYLPQFQLGYKGYIQLAMRTGQYKFINADVVYEGELKASDKLSGEIDLTGERTGDKIIGYFAHIETINGFKKTVYGRAEDVEAHAKKYSQSYANDQYKKSAWSTNFDAMALKTMIRRVLSKYGIMSVEMADAYDKDNPVDVISPEEQLKTEIDGSGDEVIDIDHTDNQQQTRPCPDRNGDQMNVEYCDDDCQNRSGCPACEDDEQPSVQESSNGLPEKKF